MARPALVLMVVVWRWRLSFGSGSRVEEPTVAVLVIVPVVLVSTVATMVMLDDVPAERIARVQVTTPALWLQLQPLPLAVLKVTPAGRVSVTMTFTASDGPLFVLLSV